MICIMQIPVDDQMSILDAVVPTIRNPAHVGTRTGVFLPVTAKSTLPFRTPGHCQAQPRQSFFSLMGLRVCAEFIEGGEV